MRVRFTAAAPIRVGGREQQVTKLEFLQHEGMVHVVSPAKLGKLLLEKSERTLEDWNVEVLTKGQGANLTAFLSEQGLLSAASIREISRYSAASSHPGMNQFQPHARDGRGTVFVPGSSLKGAIRAAVLWKRVDEERANRYVRDNAGTRARFYARRLDREVLQSYRLPGRELRAGPNFDLLRAVKVSDGYGSLETRVEKVVIQSYVEEGRGRERRTTLGASETVHAECLLPGSWAEFDLSVDRKTLTLFRERNDDLPFSDEASLLALVQNFYEQVWTHEQRYYGVEVESAPVPEASPKASMPSSFEEWLKQEKGIEAESLSRRKRRPYQAEYRRTFNLFEGGRGQEQRSPTSELPARTSGVGDGEVRVGEIRKYYAAGPCPGFRLGWGSGLMGTTVDMHLKPENMGKVLQLIDGRHHRGEPRDGPKSRKLVESEGRPRWPMGWARLDGRE
jgi:CRISPR-associated protein Csm5